MVKGTTKRVIVVKSPNPKFFEQAIFIVRDDCGGREGAKPSDVLREAQKVADDYIRGSMGSAGAESVFSRIPAPAFAGLGAAVAGLVWLVLHLLGI